MSRELTEQELHNLAMNLVGKELEADGFEFMAVNSKFKKDPQFVCLKNKDLHFVVVRHIPFPNDPKVYDPKLMNKVKNHADKFDAKTYYAGVGLSHASDKGLPVLLNEPYLVEYDGLISF